jgi:phage-related tail fiber protein
VQELAARADVKSRARAKAAAVTGRAKSTTVQVGKNAAARAGSARSQVTGQAGAARQKAISAGSAGKDQLRTRAAAVSAPVWQATPEQVRWTMTKGASRARDQWVPLAAAAAVLIVGYLAFRQRGRRSSSAPPDG